MTYLSAKNINIKLTCGEQIAFMKRKSAHILVKLYSYLQNTNADGRRDIWQTMIRPLFDVAFVLLEYDPSKTQKENLKRFRRKTFKQFMMIKRTSTAIVEEMLGLDMEIMAHKLVTECEKQWDV